MTDTVFFCKECKRPRPIEGSRYLSNYHGIPLRRACPECYARVVEKRKALR